jgi:hypothetical protein
LLNDDDADLVVAAFGKFVVLLLFLLDGNDTKISNEGKDSNAAIGAATNSKNSSGGKASSPAAIN